MDELKTVKNCEKNKEYIFLEKWGSGSYGVCFLVKELETGEFFACKINFISSRKEINLHCGLKHENIVQFIESFCYKTYNCMILEACGNGTVRLLLDCRQSLTHPEARCITMQLSNGLAYLHEQKIIHRDVKLSNLLFDNNMIVKIADFGLAIELENEEEKRTSICGTKNYMAPELFKETGYGVQVDIWALGCVHYTLITGKAPFSGKTEKQMQQNICNIKMNQSQMNKLCANFLKNIFNADPLARPTAQNIKNHAYFVENFTPNQLDQTIFFKKLKLEKQKLKRKPLVDLTNVSKENLTIEKKTFNRQTLTDLPDLDCLFDDRGQELAKRFIKEFQDIVVSETEWEFNDHKEPFICVSAWAASIDQFTYKTNNNAIGIEFSNELFYYRSADGHEILHGSNGMETFMDKKCKKWLDKALRHAETYIDCLNPAIPCIESEEYVQVVFKKCYPPENAPKVKPMIAFILSNGSCQVNYSDHEKIIVNLHENVVILWNCDKISSCSFRELSSRGIPPSIGLKIDQMCHFLAVSYKRSKSSN